MELQEAIKNRKSIREYEDKPVPEQTGKIGNLSWCGTANGGRNWRRRQEDNRTWHKHR